MRAREANLAAVGIYADCVQKNRRMDGFLVNAPIQRVYGCGPQRNWAKKKRWRYFGRYLFVYQTLILMVFGTALVQILLDVLLIWLTNDAATLRKIRRNVAMSADMPINTVLAFMFGMLVRASINARCELGAAIVKAQDFVWTTEWHCNGSNEKTEGGGDGLLLSDYRKNTREFIAKLREVASDDFAHQVLFFPFDSLHKECVGREYMPEQAEIELRSLRHIGTQTIMRLARLNSMPLTFHGYPMQNPISKVYQFTKTPVSCFEARFALISLSIFSIVSRHEMAPDNDYGATVGWGSIIFFVILLPYSLMASYVYKNGVWSGVDHNTEPGPPKKAFFVTTETGR